MAGAGEIAVARVGAETAVSGDAGGGIETGTADRVGATGEPSAEGAANETPVSGDAEGGIEIETPIATPIGRGRPKSRSSSAWPMRPRSTFVTMGNPSCCRR